MSRQVGRLIVLAAVSLALVGSVYGQRGRRRPERETITVYVLWTWKTDKASEKPQKSGVYLYRYEAEDAGEDMVSRKRCKRYKVVATEGTMNGPRGAPPRRPKPWQPPSVPIPGYHGSRIDEVEKHLNNGDPDSAEGVVKGLGPVFVDVTEATIAAGKQYNDNAKSLAEESESIAAQTDFMNNVVSLRKKDDFDKWAKEDARPNVGQRLGIISVGETSFYRYYDKEGNLVGSACYDENGDLVESALETEFDRLNARQDDWNGKRNELGTIREKLRERYGQIRDDYARLSTGKTRIADMLRQREEDRRRPQQEATRRQRQQDMRRQMEEDARRQRQEEMRRQRQTPRRRSTGPVYIP